MNTGNDNGLKCLWTWYESDCGFQRRGRFVWQRFEFIQTSWRGLQWKEKTVFRTNNTPKQIRFPTDEMWKRKIICDFHIHKLFGLEITLQIPNGSEGFVFEQFPVSIQVTFWSENFPWSYSTFRYLAAYRFEIHHRNDASLIHYWIFIDEYAKST